MRDSCNVHDIRANLIICCYWYYVKADPLVPDYAYDMLFKKLEELEREGLEQKKAERDFEYIIPPGSPTQMIYGDSEEQYPEWAKTSKLF